MALCKRGVRMVQPPKGIWISDMKCAGVEGPIGTPKHVTPNRHVSAPLERDERGGFRDMVRPTITSFPRFKFLDTPQTGLDMKPSLNVLFLNVVR